MGLTTYGTVTETYGAGGDTYAAAPAGTTVTAVGETVTITTAGTVTILDSLSNVVYTGGSGQITLPPDAYTWTDDLGGSGSFTVSSSANRMGGTGAIRKPPRSTNPAG